MKVLKEKAEDKQKTNDLDVTLREQKFTDMERELKEKEGLIKLLKEENNEFLPKIQKLKNEKEEVEKILDSKYESFEDMNRYINQLLKDKNELLASNE